MSSIVDSKGTIKNPYRNFIAISKYSRWLEEEVRRETWVESVDRFIAFYKKHLTENYNYDINAPIFAEIREAILEHEVMPSMRGLMTAGPALERSHIAGYNCSFIAVNDPRAFDEAMFISLNGTGVGFSVERRYTDLLPTIPEEFTTGKNIVIGDSKEGWSEAFRTLLEELYAGRIPTWDLSLIRPAGSPLATFGGRASGPGPIDTLFRFSIDTFQKAKGRKLSPLECHDLMCFVGDVVVSGGVRRSALISLSDLSDFDMAKAKSGDWRQQAPHRELANNSAVYKEKPSVTQFLREWRNLIESYSGERGIFNLAGVKAHAEKTGRDSSKIAGTNPCGEILLRSEEFCNLTEVVIREKDTAKTISRKIHLATILGTWQSTLTDFKLLRPSWKENCDEERLLGVSLTGIYGNKLFNNPGDMRLPQRLSALRKEAHLTNQAEAELLGIPSSAAVTCVKPSGTVSQLTGVSSGIHPWHSEFYIRTVRGNNIEPITQMLKDAGIPNEPCVSKPDDRTIFSFPVKAPEGAVLRNDTSALEHIALWTIYREFWTDHNPSVTINVRESEWLQVGSWVFDNWEKVGGMSFLPAVEHIYAQAPYQEISEEVYNEHLAKMPKEIRWADLSIYELQDGTSGSQSLACSADGEGCDVVDI